MECLIHLVSEKICVTKSWLNLRLLFRFCLIPQRKVFRCCHRCFTDHFHKIEGNHKIEWICGITIHQLIAYCSLYRQIRSWSWLLEINASQHSHLFSFCNRIPMQLLCFNLRLGFCHILHSQAFCESSLNSHIVEVCITLQEYTDNERSYR